MARVIVLIAAANIVVGSVAAAGHAHPSQKVASAGASASPRTDAPSTLSTSTTVAVDAVPSDVSETPTTVASVVAVPTTAVTNDDGAASSDTTTTTTAPPPSGPDCRNSHDPPCGD